MADSKKGNSKVTGRRAVKIAAAQARRKAKAARLNAAQVERELTNKQRHADGELTPWELSKAKRKERRRPLQQAWHAKHRASIEAAEAMHNAALKAEEVSY